MNKTEQLDGTIADVYGVQILDDVVMEIDVILGEYSIAVQELIAGHKPFDDSIDASRWRDNASQRLLSLIDKTVNEAIGEDEITPIQKNDRTTGWQERQFRAGSQNILRAQQRLQYKRSTR